MGRRVANKFALLLAMSGSFAGAAAPVGSSVWVVQGKSNRVYLAGSIHLLKPGQAALPPELERAYANAERLVFELDLDDLDQTRVAAEMMQAGTRTDGTTLLASLPAPQAKRLGSAAEGLGLPAPLIDRTEPWLASLLLTSMSLIKQGYRPESGVDQQMAQRAQSDRKPVDGLETAADQFAAFDSLPPAEQIHLLELTLDELDEGGVDLGRIEDAWRGGDQQALAALLLEEMAAFPALEQALLIARNRRWVPAIESMLQDEDDVLVVVGAAHLVGDDGLVSLLGSAGHRVLAFGRE